MPMNKPTYSENKHKRVGTVFMSLMEELKLHGDVFPTLEMLRCETWQITRQTNLGLKQHN